MSTTKTVYRMKKRIHDDSSISELKKTDSEEGVSESDDSPEDADDATAKERALTAILRKLAYEDFSALEKAALNNDDTCNCESCKERRAWTNDTLEELKLIQSYWLELRQYLRIIYRLGMKGSIKSIDGDYHNYVKNLVSRLCEVCNPHQLYQRLEGQVREFVIEVKMRLLQLMDKLADNPQLPRLFISGMLDRYNKMMTAANEITPVLKQLENEHLSKFNLTWKMLNQRLFQTSIYTDPFFQNSVPLFITQLGKGNDSDENKMLVREFLSFDDEITLVEGMWKDVEARIHQYMSQFGKDCRTEGIGEEVAGDDDLTINATDSCECHVCLDASSHSPVALMDDIVTPNLHGGGFHLYPHIHGTGGDFADVYTEALAFDACMAMDDDQTIPPLIRPNTFNAAKYKAECQAAGKEATPQKRVDKATQKDHETNMSEEKKQLTGGSGTRPTKEVPNEAPFPHSCLKHSDTIKRIPCPDQEEENTCNNHEDTHSDGSQADPRHCDCCYCEVFGHGIPTTAPMSRNYQEMRERLRLLLNKKKSKCKSNSGSPQPVVQATQKKQQNQPQEGGSKSQDTRDPRDLEDLLVYIEGTEVKCRNEKRAAKKARQREKKQILLNRQKREEEEKAKRLQEALEAKKREENLLRAAREEKECQGKSKKKGKSKEKIPAPQAQQASPKQSPLSSNSPGPQMVTIKRVMEPHNSEPTVTITLRGATPNQDKVLYTLLNGQVCKVKDSSPIPRSVSKTKPPSTSSNITKVAKQPAPSIEQNIKPAQQVKKKQGKDAKSQNTVTISKVPAGTDEKETPEIQITKSISNITKNSKPFNIEDIKLPPGITITKVDPAKVQAKSLIQDRPSKLPCATPSRSPPGSEVIVVATGKLKDSPPLVQGKEQSTCQGACNNSNKKKKPQKKTEQPNDITSLTVVHNLSSNKKKKNKKKPDQNEKAMNGRSTVYPEINIEPLDLPLKTLPQPSVSISPSVFPELPPAKLSVSSPFSEQGKKKKKKNKKTSLTSSEEMSLLDSVFAPKDIDLDDGEMDDAERELEAFKRFCFQSVPPKQKEKVHLNLKDIVLKKKTSAISCS